jgi:hypothetical protein
VKKPSLECFKKCGFVGGNLGELFAHYKENPTHHRLYGRDAYRKRQAERKWSKTKKKAKKAVLGKEVGFRKHKHLSVVGSKVNGTATRAPNVKESFKTVITYLTLEIATKQALLDSLLESQKAWAA